MMCKWQSFFISATAAHVCGCPLVVDKALTCSRSVRTSSCSSAFYVLVVCCSSPSFFSSAYASLIVACCWSIVFWRRLTIATSYLSVCSVPSLCSVSSLSSSYSSSLSSIICSWWEGGVSVPFPRLVAARVRVVRPSIALVLRTVVR